jgi:glycerol dehydrogenase
VDTFAKFYEIRPTFERNEESLNLDIAYYASRVAYTKLKTGVFKALEEAEKGIFEQSAKDVVDSIVYLAGFAGSFQTDTGYYSFAHPFYHISARFPNTRHRLHGEKVAYGILAQLFLEKKSVEDIKNVIQTFDKYQNAYTLEEIGFNRDDISELNLLAVDIIETFPHVTANVDDIIQALLDTDTLVKQVRGLN